MQLLNLVFLPTLCPIFFSFLLFLCNMAPMFLSAFGQKCFQPLQNIILSIFYPLIHQPVSETLIVFISIW